MARHNLVFLLGYVTSVQIHTPTNGQPYAFAYIAVARADRATGDHKDHMRTDNPIIMSRDPNMMREMETWQINDIVDIKGMIAARPIKKGSVCSNCASRNTAEGTLVYVNPIYAKKRTHLNTEDECMEYLTIHREVSNQVYVFGTLCRDPKKITPKEGLVVTQYQIALNRKFRIHEDPPDIRSDYPWVKSYGENAVSDRSYLRVGSKVFIDGCLQARKVNRHQVCTSCGTKYDWIDRAMEIVPYETEYIDGFLTKEEAEAKEAEIARQKAQSVLQTLTGYKPGDDVFSKEDIDAGINSDEEE